jgi:cytochrome P450
MPTFCPSNSAASSSGRKPRTYLSSEAMDFALRQVSGKPQVVRGLTEMDDPDHGRYRAILQRSFTSAALLPMEEWLRDRAKVAVDAIADRSGVCDFATDIAMPYTMRAIAHMLGFPEADDAELIRLVHGFVGAEDPQRRLAEEPGRGDASRPCSVCAITLKPRLPNGGHARVMIWQA